MPYIQQVATGIRPELNVYGSDYNTRDGTAVRDYIHVMDLAEGHVAAVQKLIDNPELGCIPINLGTGTGSTVLEMVKVLHAVLHTSYSTCQASVRVQLKLVCWDVIERAQSSTDAMLHSMLFWCYQPVMRLS